MRIKAIFIFMSVHAGHSSFSRRVHQNQHGPSRFGTPRRRQRQAFTNPIWANAWLTKAICSICPKGNEAYLTHGMEDYFEPAIEVHHNDANPSSLLKYVSHTSKNVQPGVDETVITLQDDKYPVTVKLHYVAYAKENIIKTFTEISHQEKETAETGTLCFCHAALQPAGLLSDGVFRRLDL